MRREERTTRDGDIQIFEIITSRRELREWLRDNMWDSLYSEYSSGIWTDEDSSISIWMRDGQNHNFSFGDQVSRANVDFITRMVSANSHTTVIYGDVEIVFNERYGDWETNAD